MIVWVVVDVGCLECGIDSDPIGIFATEAEATAAAFECNEATGRWRDGGQTKAQAFEMELAVYPVREDDYPYDQDKDE